MADTITQGYREARWQRRILATLYLMFLEILASRVDGCLNPEPDQGVLTSDEPRWGTTTAGLAISGFCRGGELRGGGGVGKLSGPGSGWDLRRKDESRKPSLVEVG